MIRQIDGRHTWRPVRVYSAQATFKNANRLRQIALHPRRDIDIVFPVTRAVEVLLDFFIIGLEIQRAVQGIEQIKAGFRLSLYP